MSKSNMIVIGILLIAGIATGMYGNSKARRFAGVLDSLRLQRANDIALRDSTITRLAFDVVRAESVAVAERVAFQDQVEITDVFRDSLNRVAVSAGQLRIRGDSLEREVESLAERDVSGAITTRGEIDTIGVDIHATVTVHPDLRAIWLWNVKREPIPLDFLFSCTGDLARFQISGPAWADIAIDSVVQDPTICITPTQVRSWNPFRIQVPSLPVIIGLGVLGMFVESRLHVFGGN